jgi:hypothetical protein
MFDSLKLPFFNFTSKENFTPAKTTPCPCGLKTGEKFTNLEDNKIYATPEDLINDTVIPTPTPVATTSVATTPVATTPVATSIPSIEKFNMLNSVAEQFTCNKKPKYTMGNLSKFILIVVFISLIIWLVMLFFKDNNNNTPDLINDNVIVLYYD